MLISFNNYFYSIEEANTFFKRLKGLMGKKSLEDGNGLLLKNCKSVHTYFMRFTIDVVYLDKNFIVLEKQNLQPWKCGKFVKNTKHILELNNGQSKNILPGTKMIIGLDLCKTSDL